MQVKYKGIIIKDNIWHLQSLSTDVFFKVL